MLSLKNLENHFHYCYSDAIVTNHVYTASKSFVVIPGTIRDGWLALAGPLITITWIQVLAPHACVHACVPLTCAKSLCVRKSASRGWGHARRWETPQFNMVKIPPTGQPATNPFLSSRSQRMDYTSPAPLPPTLPEFRLCRKLPENHPLGSFAEFAWVQQNNSREDCPLFTSPHLFDRTHTVQLVSFLRTIELFSCSHKPNASK